MGDGDDDDGPPDDDAYDDSPIQAETAASPSGCCKFWGAGHACGDACIPEAEQCHTPKGCACDCCKVCDAGRACGDACIPDTEQCHTPKGCACDSQRALEAQLGPNSTKMIEKLDKIYGDDSETAARFDAFLINY